MAHYGRDYGERMGGVWSAGARNYGPHRGFGGNRGEEYDRGFRRGGHVYDRGFHSRVAGPYDWNYKSRQQTNRGDPFGDRTRRTPIRAIRGEFENRGRDPDRWHGYDRGEYGPYGHEPTYPRGWR